MKIVFVTLFEELLRGALAHSIPQRSQQAGVVEYLFVNPRDFARDRHRTVDDTPYGGGAGMVLRPVEMAHAIERAVELAGSGSPVVLMSPQGDQFRQKVAAEMSTLPGMVLVCGRYEGIDERVIATHVDVEMSIGDVVLSGGEPAALLVADAVTRLLPGAVGNAASVQGESFVSARLEHPHFTRPASAHGREVPPVLLSGDHARIAAWRQAVSVLRTERRRPDLLVSVPADRAELKAIHRHGASVEEWLVEQRDWHHWWSGRATGVNSELTAEMSTAVVDTASGGKIG